MLRDKSFSWLGRFPLAVDLADTVRVVGTEDVELLVDEKDLETWVTVEVLRFPSVAGARGRLSEVVQLRDAVRELLLAHVRDTPPPRQALDLVNEASRRGPTFPMINTKGEREVFELSQDSYDVFAAEVARSTIAVLSDEAGKALAICGAPSCGMFFEPANRRQRWCSQACGNRARVARHAARSSAR